MSDERLDEGEDEEDRWSRLVRERDEARRAAGWFRGDLRAVRAALDEAGWENRVAHLSYGVADIAEERDRYREAIERHRREVLAYADRMELPEWDPTLLDRELWAALDGDR